MGSKGVSFSPDMSNSVYRKADDQGDTESQYDEQVNEQKKKFLVTNYGTEKYNPPNLKEVFIGSSSNNPYGVVQYTDEEKSSKITNVCITQYNEDIEQLSKTLQSVLDTFTPTDGVYRIYIICDAGIKETDGKKYEDFLDFLGLTKEEAKFKGDNVEGEFEDEEEKKHASGSVTLPSKRGFKVINISKPFVKRSFLNLEGNGSEAINTQTCEIHCVIKKENKGKLHSHLIFFEKCDEDEADFIVLIDSGTKIKENSIHKFIHFFKENPSYAGCCGELLLENSWCEAPLNFTIALQRLEYKIANCLDKSLESNLGYVSVLPGAFSAYDFKKIKQVRNSHRGESPRTNYFRFLSVSDVTFFDLLMKLAEDRLLCFEIIRSGYKLAYLDNCSAETDPPSTFFDLLLQRRRWINGSLAVFIYCVYHLDDYLENSTHNPIKKLGILFLFIYQIINYLVSLLSVGIYFVFFLFFIQDIFERFNIKDLAPYFSFFIYFSLLIVQVIFAMSASKLNAESKKTYILIYRGILFAFILFNAIFLWGSIEFFTDEFETLSILEIFISFFMLLYFFLIPLIDFVCFSFKRGFKNLGVILITLIPFYLISGAFTNMVSTFTWCNIHLVGWGTRGTGDVKKKEEDIQERASIYRNYTVIAWLLTNVLFSVVCYGIGDRVTFFLAVIYFFAAISAFKVLNYFYYRLYAKISWWRGWIAVD